MNNKQKHIFISGVVQGVGFRFTARILANKNNIKGWVKNLSDKRVEMIVQGESGDIDVFLKELKSDFGSNIADFKISESKDYDELNGFNIYL